MDEFINTRFGALGEIFDGPHATPTRRSEGPYFLNIACLQSGRLDMSAADCVSDSDFAMWTRRVTPQAGDLLFSYETRLGEAAMMPDGIRACLGRRMALLRPDRRIVDPRFLVYYYLSPEFQRIIAERTVHGATVPRIGLATMPEWEVVIPGLHRQQAIAEVLGALDDRIVANDIVISKVGEILGAQFEVLGIDRYPERASDNFSIDDLVELNPPERLSGVDDAVYLEMKNLPDAEMTVTNWARRPVRGGARFRNGDTLLARITPCLENGKTGYVDFLEDGQVGVGSTEFIVMRPLATVPDVLPYFLAKSARFREFAIRRMVGTSGRQRLAAQDLRDLRLTKPQEAELSAFAALSAPLMNRVRACVGESRALVRTRDELLPLLMSGKLRVKDAEKAVSDVL